MARLTCILLIAFLIRTLPADAGSCDLPSFVRNFLVHTDQSQGTKLLEKVGVDEVLNNANDSALYTVGRLQRKVPFNLHSNADLIPQEVEHSLKVQFHSMNKIYDEITAEFLHAKPQATEAILKGKPSQSVMLIVHQDHAIEPATAAFLKKSEFQDTPRLFLVNHYFNIANQDFLKEASVVRYSMGGDLTFAFTRLNADEIHLMGGSYGSCVTDALEDSLKQVFLNPKRSKVKVVVHLSQTYSTSSKPLTVELAKISEAEQVKALKAGLNSLMSPYYVKPVDYQLLNLHKDPGKVSGTALLRRKSDGKQVLIQFTD